jgi:hypothetical protein
MSLRGRRVPRETNLLLVQVSLDGDERRRGMMNRPCVEDVYGEAKTHAPPSCVAPLPRIALP